MCLQTTSSDSQCQQCTLNNCGKSFHDCTSVVLKLDANGGASPTSSSPNNLGPIIGGAMGGIVFLALGFGGILYARSSKNRVKWEELSASNRKLENRGTFFDRMSVNMDYMNPMRRQSMNYLRRPSQAYARGSVSDATALTTHAGDRRVSLAPENAVFADNPAWDKCEFSAQAQFEFVAEHPGELTIKAGQQVQVLGQQGDWYYGGTLDSSWRLVWSDDLSATLSDSLVTMLDFVSAYV